MAGAILTDVTEQDREIQISALYSIFSTDMLLGLRRAFVLDGEAAELGHDPACVAFCVRRIELIDRELSSRGVLFG